MQQRVITLLAHFLELRQRYTALLERRDGLLLRGVAPLAKFQDFLVHEVSFSSSTRILSAWRPSYFLILAS